jgi:uncharacterized RDD family membrane protein YckC
MALRHRQSATVVTRAKRGQVAAYPWRVPQNDPTYAPADLTPATWGRRILAIVVDWVTCLAVVEGLVAVGVLAGNPNGLGTLGLFVLESALFTALAGGSFGKLATRVRVVRKDAPGQPVSLLRALVRSVLVAMLVPPLLTFDGRGLHDLAAGTRTVTI